MAGLDSLGPALQGDRLTESPVSAVDPPFADLIEKLEHDFRQPELLEEALTHQSATDGEGRGKRNLERLEFLGDRVLGLVIAHLLMEEFPEERVGQLARRHAALVRAESLTHVARQLGLGANITMSRGEQEQGGRDKPRTLADCCEAVIAALYLDGGLDAASQTIRRYWCPMMHESADPPEDPKTALQEWAQARALPLPAYTVLRRVGAAHAPVFEVECDIRGLPPVRAEGRSRRAAEQTAAGHLLDLIRRGPTDER